MRFPARARLETSCNSLQQRSVIDTGYYGHRGLQICYLSGDEGVTIFNSPTLAPDPHCPQAPVAQTLPSPPHPLVRITLPVALEFSLSSFPPPPGLICAPSACFTRQCLARRSPTYHRNRDDANSYSVDASPRITAGQRICTGQVPAAALTEGYDRLIRLVSDTHAYFCACDTGRRLHIYLEFAGRRCS